MSETTTTINWQLLAGALDAAVTAYNKLRSWHDLVDRSILAARAAGESATGETAAAVIGKRRPPAKQVKYDAYAAANRIVRLLDDSYEQIPHTLDEVGQVIDRARAAIREHLEH